MSRRQRKLAKETNPEKAAKIGDKKGVKDAFCTECNTDYDSNSKADRNRHAH